MNRPTLSVVVPNYNHGKYLPTCLDAILTQSWQPDELIVIDDASTDNSLEVINGYCQKHPRIRCLKNEINRGVVAGMNRGLEEAQSSYVFFAAADDYVLPGFIEKSLPLLARYPAAALCCTIGDWREQATGLNWHVAVGMADEPGYLSPRKLVELEQQGRLLIASHTAIMKRSALLHAGGFIPDLKWHCDWFAIHVAAFRDGICFVPEPLGVFNAHATSYYQRGRQNRLEYRQVLVGMLDRLNQVEFADAAGLIRESGALSLFGKPMLGLLARQTEYRRFLTSAFLRKAFWRILQLEMKKITPTWLGNLYLKRSRYHARPQGHRAGSAR